MSDIALNLARLGIVGFNAKNKYSDKKICENSGGRYHWIRSRCYVKDEKGNFAKNEEGNLIPKEYLGGKKRKRTLHKKHFKKRRLTYKRRKY